MVEDEFGIIIDGFLKIFCDGSLMDYVIMFVRRSMFDNYDDDGEKKLEDCFMSICKGVLIFFLIFLFCG